jgi:hypothetical protein
LTVDPISAPVRVVRDLPAQRSDAPDVTAVAWVTWGASVAWVASVAGAERLGEIDRGGQGLAQEQA